MSVNSFSHRTKIVATIGPASQSEMVIRELVKAGMNVARLNFSHGSYDDHGRTIERLRKISTELDHPITLLQDLQGPKIRVGQLPKGEITLNAGEKVILIPNSIKENIANCIPIDYPHLAEDAQPGAQVLLDDGNLELEVGKIEGTQVYCRVITGGILKSRKGVNFPNLNLSLPSLTAKDQEDLEFGIAQEIDWVCLSFVRGVEDIHCLKDFLKFREANIPVIAKIEKPQAIENFDELVKECDGMMVARGDLGVEMRPEKVPLLQKKIIQSCNKKGIPVITATQMLESMINSPRPTRAEASDVANAIIDGTDAIMLSGESAMGNYPIAAIKTMASIAEEIEPEVQFINYPPAEKTETHALSESLNCIDKIINLRCIACFTTTGYTARIASDERPKAPIVAFTPSLVVYHRLNLIWGVKPLLLQPQEEGLEVLITEMESCLLQRNLVASGDKILILGGSPIQQAKGTNFLKIHTVSREN
ncbi:pyruvate kinase [Dactylococcopsis salina]|uniref:Pyruvate kinase n=1 Tax=Dactylococcopsis salina (strain PCC 8305) TaxID=13035 RepID=K9YWI2_DACS8|nr:pyruvate kinase [Dactylococcopsis salina]AFZ51259.1 pyruvate kinase [Dactylococcopsis salina PCC 8305]